MTGLPGITTGPKPRSVSRRLAGVLTPPAVVATAASVGITQWMAGHLRHHPALGAPWFDGWYAPWSWVQWRMAGWPGAARTYELVDGGLMMAVCATPMIAGWLLSQKKNKPKRHEGVHGTAKLAERGDLESAGLLSAKKRNAPERGGMYLAAHEEKDGSLTYIRHDGPEHIMCIGPTRCGKTLGPSVMNCLSGADDSLIVYDAKGSIYRDTAGWRRSVGQRILRWDIMALNGAVRWNPFDEVRLGTVHEFSDTANIIENIADPDGEGLDNPRDHFPPVAAEFLTGLALFVMYEARAKGKRGCLADALRAMKDPDRAPDALYAAMASNRFGPKGTRHEQIAGAGVAQAKRPDREGGSVLSTASRMLRLFADPIIARNTSRSDFSISDLMDGDRPASLYVIPREEHRLRLRPLTRLFNTMVTDRLCSVELLEPGKRPHRHRLRWIYDEFTSEKKQEKFVSAMARCAEYGIRVMLLAQDYQQIIAEYGRDETVSGACHIKVGYTPNNEQTADWMASWSGRTTLHTEDISESGSSGEGKRGFNRSYHTVSRELLTSDEVGRIKRAERDETGERITAPGQVLVKVAGSHVALETQALYFFDPEFAERAAMPVPLADGARRAA